MICVLCCSYFSGSGFICRGCDIKFNPWKYPKLIKKEVVADE